MNNPHSTQANRTLLSESAKGNRVALNESAANVHDELAASIAAANGKADEDARRIDAIFGKSIASTAPTPGAINAKLAKSIVKAGAPEPEYVGDLVLTGAKLAAVIRIGEQLRGNVFAATVTAALSRVLATGEITPEQADAFAADKLAEAQDVARILSGQK